MTNPLQGTLENQDGAWVLTLVRENAGDEPVTGDAIHRMSSCTAGATTSCAGDSR